MSTQSDVGNIAGAFLNNLSASDASDKQMNAAMAAIAEQHREYDIGQQNQMPWLTAGQGAVNRLSWLMQPGGDLAKTTPSMSDLMMDPGYQFALKQGQASIGAQMGARGLAGSGNLGSALIDYSTGDASKEYQQAYNNWMTGQNTLYNRLAGISGTGQVTAGEMANQGQQYANAYGQQMTNYGNAAAGGVPQWGNMVAGVGNNMNNQMMSGLGAYLQYQQQQNQLNAYQSMYGGGYGESGYSPAYTAGGESMLGNQLTYTPTM